MYQRPKAGESEEDLLKLQEQFLKDKQENKITPAAKLVLNENDGSQSQLSTSNKTSEDLQYHLDNTFEDIPKNFAIGKIVPKQAGEVRMSTFKFSQKAGFPQAKRREITASTGRGSLFAQNMKKLKLNTPDDMEVDQVDPQPMSSTSLRIVERTKDKVNMSDTSYIITGKDKNAVHQTNVDLMSQMTEEEIIEEREKLMSTMDPAIVAFLKSKRYHNRPVEETRQPTIAEQNKASENFEMEETETTKEIVSQVEASKWINFDILETNKLAWMKDVKVPKITKDQKYEARFDFQGWLQPFAADEINEENRSLYHHGEEPGRPGYTLQELFQLSRSSIVQQKIVALNTIANILSLQSSGVYNDIIELPIEQIFFVIRFCLDENTPATLNASIKSLRNLFYYPIDETCLDNLLGFGVSLEQPILAVDNSESEDDNTINDQQLAETNLIKCLARTEILTRIRYIFDQVRPSIDAIVYCLEILVRMCRDSEFIMKRVYKCDGLLETVISNFVPAIFKPVGLNSAYGLPIFQALKLLRVLSARDKNIALEIVTRYKIFNSIATYIASEFVSENTNGLKLQIESLQLLQVFASYGVAINEICSMQPLLLRLLNYHLSKTNVSEDTSYVIQAHVAAFLNLMAQVALHNYGFVTPFVRMITSTESIKWITQINNLDKFSCGKLQIISSLFNLLGNTYECTDKQKLAKSVHSMILSEGFKVVTQSIRSGSNLLNIHQKESHKSSANLKHTEAAMWSESDHIIPVLQTRSCIPFLTAFSTFLLKFDDKSLIISFLNHENLITYYRHQLGRTTSFNLINNWFTKVETTLVMNILKLAVIVWKNVDYYEFYRLAVTSLSLFSIEHKNDVKFLLKNVVFNPGCYPTDLALSRLSLNEGSPESKIINDFFKHVDEVFAVYANVLGLNVGSANKSSRSVDTNLGNMVPIDWMYSPILLLYSNQQQQEICKDDTVDSFTLLNCLRWIYFYELNFADLAKTINPTDRFCRLACTFLGSDCLFLNPEIRMLLELCLRHVLAKYSKQLHFDGNIQGLNNFQDFYTQLLEQYQGVSYGDVVFGNCILAPLAQKHSIKLKKTLWSEYAGVLQILMFKPDQAYIPMDDFLVPTETDLSLLSCYRRALSTGTVRKGSVLYEIAKHHVQTNAKERKNVVNK